MLVSEQIRTLANLVLQYLRELPDGTEITTEEALQQVCATGDVAPYADWDLCEWNELHLSVWDRAKRKGLILDDSQYANQCVGLFYRIPYVVRHKKPSP